MHRYAWLFVVVALTWPSVDARFTVNVQRRVGGSVQTLAPQLGTAMLDTEVPAKQRSCWRWRYAIPQRTGWSAWTCLRVR